jgi:hypothetical protein
MSPRRGVQAQAQSAKVVAHAGQVVPGLGAQLDLLTLQLVLDPARGVVVLTAGALHHRVAQRARDAGARVDQEQLLLDAEGALELTAGHGGILSAGAGSVLGDRDATDPVQ